MMPIQPVDRLEILVVVDNYADVLLPSAPGVDRAPLADGDSLPSDTLLAEHGLFLLLTATWADRRSRLVVDAGYSPVAAPRNLARLIAGPLDGVCGLVVSHGHLDHVGALHRLLEMTGRPSLVVHPEAFRTPRLFRTDDGHLLRMPEMPTRLDLEREGIKIVDSLAPTLLDEVYLVTGETPRVTSFERGLPGALRSVTGKLVHDPILDDQAVVVDVAECGLVIISGCAHAGIINTLRYARKLVPDRPIHAVVGGFHLAGESQRLAIDPTIAALAAEHPARLVPMHCTGPEAKRRLQDEFGSTCVDSSVGTRFTFGGAAPGCLSK